MATLDLAFPPCPHDVPPLGAREAHVWRIDLNGPRASLLSAGEQRRAEAMTHPEKRAHFVAARSALRVILSRYMGQSPESLPITTMAQGKPCLDLPDALHFNLSHAQGKALVAVARMAVGIDLEFPRSLRQMDKLVADYFAPEEAREMDALPEQDRAQAFLAAWTRKEACLKATGEGIGGGLHRYRVSLRPQEEAKLVSIDGESEKASAWTLHAFAPFDEAQAAICLAAPDMSLRGFTL
jgi:4'-phosphopantetheinyl transferase